MNHSRLEWYSEHIMKRDLLYKLICPFAGNIYTLPKIQHLSLNVSSSTTSGSQATPNTSSRQKMITLFSGLEILSGQKVKKTYAKKSIASFKLRKGQCIGGKVTLRNKEMYFFLEKFFFIVLPKIREFVCLQPNTHDSTHTLSSINFSGGSFLLYPELSNQYELFESNKGFNATLIMNTNHCSLHTVSGHSVGNILISFFVP
uniref:Ribosomal protein L5 n=1 Tax=Monomastix sp. (strain OKE-1) TaxID=141716 RepID=U5YGK6_MONSK|nr:ribosomal protein L5 [Monomastix sp. OKE-1]AGZ90206.1 ribosomal protein L5 [Monomastix sp. OKE-1]